MKPEPLPEVSSALFRQEAVVAHQRDWIASKIIAVPWPVPLLIVLVPLFTLGFLGLLRYSSYTEQVPAFGILVPGRDLTCLLASRPPLVASIHIPEKAIPFARIGMSVRLRFQALPDRAASIQGAIACIGAKPIQEGYASSGGGSFYEAIILLGEEQLVGQIGPMPLREGMHVQASLPARNVDVLSWIIKPRRTPGAG